MENVEAVHVVSEIRTSRKPGVFIICFDHDTALLCPDDVVVRLHLHKGCQITSAQMQNIITEAERALACRTALDMVAQGRQTAQQLDAGLQRHGFGAESRAQAVERMRELGYLNDAAFAQSLVATLEQQGKLGSKRIRSELIKRGVNRELVAEALANLDPDLERANALRLLRKRWQPEFASDPAAIKRITAFLLRRGFEWPTIRWCLEQQAPEVDIDSDEG